MRPRLVLALVLALAVAGYAGLPVAATQGWVIQSFDATYVIRPDGVVEVTEDIRVDFGSLSRHGIYRDMPVEYAFDPKHKRSIPIRVLGVDDGARKWQYETSRAGANLRIKIGDPDREVSGQQRYRITYEITGGLNAFDDHDELYWNTTGDQWEVSVERATAIVQAPGIDRVTCFQGQRGSTTPCESRLSSGAGRFSGGPLPPGSGLTVVVALPKGVVDVPPPRLIEIKTPGEAIADFLGLTPMPIFLAVVVALGVGAGIYRLWWLNGRDRWSGDVHYLTGSQSQMTKPLFARETVVPEFAPPEVDERRALRPAEIGLLLDERADTLDVSATIVDFAVRRYLLIEEAERRKYTLRRLKPADEGLLPYEKALLAALFESGDVVKLSDLKEKFYDDLAQVKKALYEQGVRADRFFSGNPESVRRVYRLVGLAVTALGGVAFFVAGGLGLALVPLPLALGGLALILLAPAMPRRTASGRELYRRSLGFREFMVTAETDRARFAEEENIFDKYLPYAIVFGCTEKWAETFASLETAPPSTGYWYASSRPFVLADFASDIDRFSSSVSSVMTSTPSSSGGSGFSGGFSGGGGGGGGGGSW